MSELPVHQNRRREGDQPPPDRGGPATPGSLVAPEMSEIRLIWLTDLTALRDQ